MLRHAARGHLAPHQFLLGDCSVVKLLLSTAHPKQNSTKMQRSMVHSIQRTCLLFGLSSVAHLMGSQAYQLLGCTTSGHSCRKIKAQRPS